MNQLSIEPQSLQQINTEGIHLRSSKSAVCLRQSVLLKRIIFRINSPDWFSRFANRWKLLIFRSFKKI